MTTALLFDRDDVDEIDDWSGRLPRLSRSSILWIDLEDPDDEEIRHLVSALDLTEESAKRLTDPGGPRFADCGSYVHVTAFVPSETRPGVLERVGCLVAKQWVVTVHEWPVPVLDTYRARTEGAGETGRLDGLEFLANLLEWVIGSYLEEFEKVELALEEFDTRSMRGDVASHDDKLRELVDLRARIGRLRRALVAHRELLLALGRTELSAIVSSESAERFVLLRERLEEAVQAARDSRESVIGSFDVLIASTGQRTNEIMKVLTLASVLLLPGALIASIMGMNFSLGIFRNDAYFWVVVALMLSLAGGTLVTARVRRWI